MGSPFPPTAASIPSLPVGNRRQFGNRRHRYRSDGFVGLLQQFLGTALIETMHAINDGRPRWSRGIRIAWFINGRTGWSTTASNLARWTWRWWEADSLPRLAACPDFPEPLEAEGQGSGVDMATFNNQWGGLSKSYLLWELIWTKIYRKKNISFGRLEGSRIKKEGSRRVRAIKPKKGKSFCRLKVSALDEIESDSCRQCYIGD